MRKGIVLTIMIFGWLFGPPSNVQKAHEAYLDRNYAQAQTLYAAAFEDYKGQHPSLNFNVGQCWLWQDSAQKALTWFGKVTNAHQEDPQMASWAWNQVGTVFALGKDLPPQGQPAMNPGSQPGSGHAPTPAPGTSVPGMGERSVPREKLEQALQAFKDALKLDHDNDIARYNYELVKRKLEEMEQQQDQQQQQQDQQQDQQQQDQQQQQKPKPQPDEKKGQQQQQQPDAGQMTPQEAERILDAMNANEKKFLQQLEKSKKHRTYNQDGPDW